MKKIDNYECASIFRATATAFAIALFSVIWCCDKTEAPSNDNSIERAGAKKITKEAAAGLPKVDGHRVYVPVYSHIYHQNGKVFNLTNTLSIRNTDSQNALYIEEVSYHDTKGALVRDYLESPVLLPPLATLDYIIGENDTAGGSGANFIVEWFSEKPITKPVIECVMIGTQSQQGVSFISMGAVLD